MDTFPVVSSSSVSAEPLSLSQDIVISPVSPKAQLLGRAELSGCPPPCCQTFLQSCGAWTGCAGEVELGCSSGTACRRSCMARESSKSACSLLSPWLMGRGAGSWGAVPGHISRPEIGVFLPDGCSLFQR